MCGRAPDCVAIGLTNGQLSTDSFNASQVIARLTGLRVPAPFHCQVKPKKATAGREWQRQVLLWAPVVTA